MTRSLASARNRRRAVPGGEQIFQRIYTRLGCEGRPPHFVVEYHPYADLTHTIRLREDTAHVRLSDVHRTTLRAPSSKQQPRFCSGVCTGDAHLPS